MKHMVTIKHDINVWFKKYDVVQLIEVDEKSQLIYVYSKKHKKYMWLMVKDVM